MALGPVVLGPVILGAILALVRATGETLAGTVAGGVMASTARAGVVNTATATSAAPMLRHMRAVPYLGAPSGAALETVPLAPITLYSARLNAC